MAAGRMPPFKQGRREVLAKPAQALYCVEFNLVDHRYKHILAACGSNKVYVLRADPEDEGVQLLHTFVDEDPAEEYYCLKWVLDLPNLSQGARSTRQAARQEDESTAEPSRPLLLVAGWTGVVKLLDVGSGGNAVHRWIGHGKSINEIGLHPGGELFATASKDESVRVWNLKTRVCVLVLGGEGGHSNEVVSLDFTLQGHRLLTCGVDKIIKIWDMAAHDDILTESQQYSGPPSAFRTRRVQVPLLSTSALHPNYVDCIRCYGDLAFSKSLDNKVTLWKPEFSPYYQMDTVSALREFELRECNLWFIKFCLDPEFRYLALGNAKGKIFVFDIKTPGLKKTLVNRGVHGPVRQTSFNASSTVLVGCCEDGSIVRWDLETHQTESERQAMLLFGSPLDKRKDPAKRPA